MIENRDWKGEFSLAFIEELEQGGISFHFEHDANFVKGEYPHYSAEFEAAMKKLYRLWQKNPEKLARLKRKLEQSLGQVFVEKIKSDASFRFFILKGLHDSMIENVTYDEQTGVLTMKIDYDDAFCKIPFGTSLTYVFGGVEEFYSDIPELKEAYLLISSDWHEIENGKIKLYFCGMDVNREYVDWEISFFYNRFEIHGEEGDDDCKGEV